MTICGGDAHALSSTLTQVKGLQSTAHLIVHARLGELGGVVPLIPRLDKGLGVLWNGQVQAVDT